MVSFLHKDRKKRWTIRRNFYIVEIKKTTEFMIDSGYCKFRKDL